MEFEQRFLSRFHLDLPQPEPWVRGALLRIKKDATKEKNYSKQRKKMYDSMKRSASAEKLTTTKFAFTTPSSFMSALNRIKKTKSSPEKFDDTQSPTFAPPVYRREAHSPKKKFFSRNENSSNSPGKFASIRKTRWAASLSDISNNSEEFSHNRNITSKRKSTGDLEKFSQSSVSLKFIDCPIIGERPSPIGAESLNGFTDQNLFRMNSVTSLRDKNCNDESNIDAQPTRPPRRKNAVKLSDGDRPNSTKSVEISEICPRIRSDKKPTPPKRKPKTCLSSLNDRTDSVQDNKNCGMQSNYSSDFDQNTLLNQIRVKLSSRIITEEELDNTKICDNNNNEIISKNVYQEPIEHTSSELIKNKIYSDKYSSKVFPKDTKGIPIPPPPPPPLKTITSAKYNHPSESDMNCKMNSNIESHPSTISNNLDEFNNATELPVPPPALFQDVISVGDNNLSNTSCSSSIRNRSKSPVCIKRKELITPIFNCSNIPQPIPRRSLLNKNKISNDHPSDTFSYPTPQPRSRLDKIKSCENNINMKYVNGKNEKNSTTLHAELSCPPGKMDSVSSALASQIPSENLLQNKPKLPPKNLRLRSKSPIESVDALNKKTNVEYVENLNSRPIPPLRHRYKT